MTIRSAALFLLFSLTLSKPVLAQFGGRDGDAVLLVVSAKGNADFQVVPPSTVNTRSDFIIQDPSTLFDEPFGPDFPGESRRLMHRDTGDIFNMIIQREGIQSPHQYLQGPVKVMIFQGLLRLFPPNEPPVDPRSVSSRRFPIRSISAPTSRFFLGSL